MEKYVNIKFVAGTRCLMMLDEQGQLLKSKFYGEYDENISSMVNVDMKSWLMQDKEITSYSHDLNELNEVPDYHTIKVNFTDNDSLTTRIRGTLKEVIDYYKNINFLTFESASKENQQIKKIEFIESPVLNDAKSYSYLFMDLENVGLLQ